MNASNDRAELRADHEAHARTVEEVIRQRLSAALGGWRGSLEAALPTVAFVIGWTVTKDLRTSIGAAAGIIVILALIRLGQRQSLQYVASAAFATALRLLMLDEPTTGQDAPMIRSIMELLSRAVAAGEAPEAMVFSTHDLATTVRYADRVFVVAGGTLVRACTPDELLADAALLEQAELRSLPRADREDR